MVVPREHRQATAAPRVVEVPGCGAARPVGSSFSRYEADIAEAIWIVLGTAPGSSAGRTVRLRHPPLVFAPINARTSATSLPGREALGAEPRIDLLDVGVSGPRRREPDPDPRRSCRIRADNAVQSLVYPFYVTEGGVS